MDNSAPSVTPIPANGAISPISDMPVSPTSVASSGHFPFTASELSGMGVDTSALDTAFTSDVAPPDNGNSSSFSQIPWNFSLSDLTADLSNLGGNLNLHYTQSSYHFFCFLDIYTSLYSLMFTCFSYLQLKKDKM